MRAHIVFRLLDGSLMLGLGDVGFVECGRCRTTIKVISAANPSLFIKGAVEEEELLKQSERCRAMMNELLIEIDRLSQWHRIIAV